MSSLGVESALDRYFRKRALTYVLIVVLFTMGSVFGAVAVNALTTDQRTELGQYLHSFFTGLNAGVPVVKSAVVRESLLLNVLRTGGLIWLLGVSVIGAPAILVIVFARGFALGFTVGLLVREMALGGAALALVSVLPQNLLLIPALVVVSVASVSFAWSLLRGRVRRTESLGERLTGFTALTVLAMGVMGIAALVEGYITPVLVELAARYLV